MPNPRLSVTPGIGETTTRCLVATFASRRYRGVSPDWRRSAFGGGLHQAEDWPQGVADDRQPPAGVAHGLPVDHAAELQHRGHRGVEADHLEVPQPVRRHLPGHSRDVGSVDRPADVLAVQLPLDVRWFAVDTVDPFGTPAEYVGVEV